MSKDRTAEKIRAEKARLARNAYAKKWRDNNKDKVKQYQEAYFVKLADRLGL